MFFTLFASALGLIFTIMGIVAAVAALGSDDIDIPSIIVMFGCFWFSTKCFNASLEVTKDRQKADNELEALRKKAAREQDIVSKMNALLGKQTDNKTTNKP